MGSCPDLRELPAVERTGWPWSEASPATPEAGSRPRISIVVTSYQQGSFLEETLRSVLLQAYPELELLVIDGGSTDASVEILERYGPWLAFWSSEPDRGQSDAINRGLARTTGDVVTFFGSDDVYEPGTFHDVARQWLEHPGCGGVVGAFRFMDETSRRLPVVHPPRLPGPGPHDLALLDTASWRLHQVATFYSRRALDEVGRWVREDLDYTMDRELLYRVCRRFPAVLTDRPYAAFRRHRESKSTSMILPMSREMADLHLLDAPAGEPRAVRRRRRALWRERRSRGCVKLARSGVGGWRSAAALLGAAVFRPSLLARRHYLVLWLAAMRLLPAARRLYQALSRSAEQPPSMPADVHE